MPRSVGLAPNIAAFLDMIAWSEIGPELLAKSDDGYDVQVGSTPKHPILIHNYYDHPNVLDKKLDSTAFGRYQIIHKYWPQYKKLLKLPDISPLSQDRYAIQVIREQKALPLILQGKIQLAIFAVCDIWASFPGPDNTYKQRKNKMSDLILAFLHAGGQVSE